MWPIERSPRNEARPRVARIGTVAIAASRRRRSRSPRRRRRRARSSASSTGTSTSSIVFCAAVRFAARLHGLDRLAERLRHRRAVVLGRQRLAERHEQRAVERARGAADLHHQRHADAFAAPRASAGRRSPSRSAAHRLEAALHVDAVVAVADRLIEPRQLARRGRSPRSRHRSGAGSVGCMASRPSTVTRRQPPRRRRRRTDRPERTATRATSPGRERRVGLGQACTSGTAGELEMDVVSGRRDARPARPSPSRPAVGRLELDVLGRTPMVAAPAGASGGRQQRPSAAG